MKFMKVLALVTMLAASSFTFGTDAPADQAVHLKSVQDLMAAMQTEKMMRSITGASGFSSEAQRAAAFAKLAKIAPAEIHQRLARPLRRSVSMPTAVEMTRYYLSSYGKRVLQQEYNSGPSFGGPSVPAPTASERKELSRPDFLKAKKEFDAAEQTIRHEAFLLLQAINKT